MIRALAMGGALLALLALPARAQAPEGAGARAAALGGAFVGLADDGYAVFWNPGALPFVGHQELSAPPRSATSTPTITPTARSSITSR